MAVGLVPYVWKSDPGDISHWELPEGSKSAIDLRRLDQIVDPQAIGYAIAEYDVLPDGAIPLDTGNVTLDRDAWLATLGYRPEGEHSVDWAWSHLIDGADDTHADACRPLRCGIPDSLELWLGDRHERPLGYTDWLRQAVLVRRDLDAIFDDVIAGKLPEDAHRKMLLAEARRLGIDWQTLRPKTARWRSETPLEPETTITDDFPAGGYVALNTYNSWTTPQSALPYTVGSGELRIEGFVSGLTNGGTYAAWNATTLSSSNNQADLLSVTTKNFGAGPICRGNGTATGYFACCASGNVRLFLAPGVTSLGTSAKAADPVRLRVQAIGSTIKASDNNSTWKISVTNTSVTTGLRVGAFLQALDPYAGQYVTADSFYARDFLTPASISTAPSSGSTAGGTAITITGTGFEPNATVSVKGASATGVTVVSETSITATTPAGTAGAGDVVVTNPDTGFSGTQSNGFTYAESTASGRLPSRGPQSLSQFARLNQFGRRSCPPR